jgi:hypothetical protein
VCCCAPGTWRSLGRETLTRKGVALRGGRIQTDPFLSAAFDLGCRSVGGDGDGCLGVLGGNPGPDLGPDPGCPPGAEAPALIGQMSRVSASLESGDEVSAAVESGAVGSGEKATAAEEILDSNTGMSLVFEVASSSPLGGYAFYTLL